jgi:hypothetical protein
MNCKSVYIQRGDISKKRPWEYFVFSEILLIFLDNTVTAIILTNALY